MRHRFGPSAFGHRWLGLGSLLAGLLVIGFVQSIAPIATPPLYDGVVPIDPYRWLNPAAGQPGGAKGASGTVDVKGTDSPLVAIATSEQPPQAQVFAIEKTLVMPHGATRLKVSIEPIATDREPVPTDGHIAGNVYRILITDQAGGTVTALASGKVTVVLRGPDGLASATIDEVTGGTWRPLKTSSAGFASTYLAVVTDFGDFALVAPGAGPSASGSSAAAGSPGGSAASAAPSASGALLSGAAASASGAAGSSVASAAAVAASAVAGSGPAVTPGPSGAVSGAPAGSGGSGPPVLAIGAAIVVGLIGLVAFVLGGPRGGGPGIGTGPPTPSRYEGAHREP